MTAHLARTFNNDVSAKPLLLTPGNVGTLRRALAFYEKELRRLAEEKQKDAKSMPRKKAGFEAEGAAFIAQAEEAGKLNDFLLTAIK